MTNIQLFDSTLRDGAQGAHISFSVEDKLNIIRILDELGLDFIEAGNPFASPAEGTFFRRARELSLSHAKLVAFGSTRRKNSTPEEDANLKSLLDAGTEYVAIFGKSHIFHVTDVLGVSREENLAMIGESVAYLTSAGKKVIFDAEHFFDGYETDPDYALAALSAAAEHGAVTLCLCDTNGGMFPDRIGEIVTKVKALYPALTVAIHCHNDGDMAVADSIAAVLAGATQVQGTFLGFGERCGNANLVSILSNLQLKRGYACIPAENLPKVYEAAHAVADIANTSVPRNQPYVGNSAFAHKAGMHADGVLKSHISFEHVDPARIGNHRKLLLSELSGKSVIFEKLKNYFPHLEKGDPAVGKVAEALKERAAEGYSFESAEASFVLMAKRILGEYRSSFDLISFKIINEQPAIEGVAASAIIKVRVNGATKLSAADGIGPVNAMDLGLRKALEEFYPEIAAVSLQDYKVRVLNAKATASLVRVLITSTNGKESWTTVGVSEDIIQASWIALTDSIDYALMQTSHKQ